MEALAEGRAGVSVTLMEAEVLALALAERVSAVLREAETLGEAVKSPTVRDTVAVTVAESPAVALPLPPLPLKVALSLACALGVALGGAPLADNAAVRLSSAEELAEGLAEALEGLVAVAALVGEAGADAVTASVRRGVADVAALLEAAASVSVATLEAEGVAVCCDVALPSAVPQGDAVSSAVSEKLAVPDKLAKGVEVAEVVEGMEPERLLD